MLAADFALKNDYWDSFKLLDSDIESLYNTLLEKETPLPTIDLAKQVIAGRIKAEREAMERRKSNGGDIYLPRNNYDVGQLVIFPALDWDRGTVAAKRKGFNPDMQDFDVIDIDFESGSRRSFAAGVENHSLNDPPEMSEQTGLMNPDNVLEEYGEQITSILEGSLEQSEEFVRIAGRWFPRALLIDIHIGQLNLAEAVLDMEGGGPVPTTRLLEMVEVPANVNPMLAEFSLDFALWRDDRFDEVGPTGEIQWFLRRLEPEDVLRTPKYLRYYPVEYDRDDLLPEMLQLEKELDDELSPLEPIQEADEDIKIRLIFPHLRSGALPLSSKLIPLFPTAQHTPKVRFTLVDGETGNTFPGWVVREARYVYGLKDFYTENALLPGALVRVQRGATPGQVVIHAERTRETREWLRTVLTGSDGGLVLAMLKQFVSTRYDERMAIATPDLQALDAIWDRHSKERTPFERIVVNLLRELGKLNPQGNVHASELYAAVNLVRRTPPGPIFALLNSRPWFQHVGDLYFKLDDTAGQ